MMKNSLICMVVICALSSLTGCKNTLFDPTSYSTAKTNSEPTPQAKTVNTAQIDKDLQSIYARNWKEDFSKKRTAGAIQQIGYEQPSYQQKQQLTVSELLNKGESAKRSGQSREAASYYHAILKRKPKHPIAHHQLAVLADKRRDFITAEEHYLSALQQKRDDPDLYSDLGYSYLMQNKLQAAESYLQQALQLRPAHQLALNNLGILYGRTGNYNRALDMFRRTGTEQEANQKLAALIPPDQSQQNHLPQNQPQTQMAQHQYPPTRQQQQPSGEIQKTAGETIQEIRQKMDQAREAAIAKRNGSTQRPQPKRSNPPPQKFSPSERTIPLIPDRSSQTTLPKSQPRQNNIRQQQLPPQQYQPQQQYQQQYRNQIDPRLQQQMKTGRLPDNRLNDAFRSIEQSDYNRQSQSYHNQSQRQNSRQGNSNTRQQQSMRLLHPERTRQDVNPLDSMQEWKPPASRYKQRPNTETSQQQIPARSNSSHSYQSKNSSFLPREYQSSQNGRQQQQPLRLGNGQHPPSLSQTQKQAAQVGMSGGLGGMSVDTQQQAGNPASHRSFPGTNSRTGGLEYGPTQPYTQPPRKSNIQHSDYNKNDKHDYEAERLNSAMYWKSPRQGNATNEHRQQYEMRQSQYRNQQLSQDRSTVNQEYHRQSQHLTRQPHPLGNGTFSPQAGQYYGPDQYKKATSNYEGNQAPR